MEITITGTNAITYPSLHIWDWTVSVYLFCGGLAAGLLIMSAIANLKAAPANPEDRVDAVRAALLAPFVLMFGMLFIWLDLERHFNTYWFFLSFRPTAPMSWGAWGLGLGVPVSLAYALSNVSQEHRQWLRFDFLKELAARLNPYLRPLAKIVFALGIFIGIYTGVLLSNFVARPFWNSPLLPICFLTSALSSGAALIILIATRSSTQLFFTKLNICLITGEVVILALEFLGGLTSTASHRESVIPFFAFTPEYFVFGVAFLLIVLLFSLALVLMLLSVKGESERELSGAARFRMKLSAVMVLAAAFIIRLAWVYAGQLTKLS
ncbi:MAG: NrfD/PsrC family molybdoenzyme membrane anchor subunit [Desulfobaccales bacterium]